MRSYPLLVFAVSMLSIFVHVGASAQNEKEPSFTKPTDAAAEKHSVFKVSLSYLSNSVFYGRRDSARAPYFTPTVRYSDKSGFYLEASLSYLAAAKKGGVDLGTIGAGYVYKDGDDKLITEVFANKYITSKTAYSVKSALRADAGVNASYDLGVVALNGELYSLFSSKTDISTGVGFFRDISLNEDETVTISPSANLYAGTDNFYEDYFANRKFSKRRRGTITVPTTVTPIVKRQGFGILDYEFSSPLEYETNKMGLYFIPAYAIPTNPISYSLDNGATYKTERFKNAFSIELGVYLKFGDHNTRPHKG